MNAIWKRQQQARERQRAPGARLWPESLGLFLRALSCIFTAFFPGKKQSLMKGTIHSNRRAPVMSQRMYENLETPRASEITSTLGHTVVDSFVYEWKLQSQTLH